MHRYKFVLFRPLQFLPVLFGISVITFVLVRLIPGDPARVLLGTRATPTAIANIRAQYGLDEPLLDAVFLLPAAISARARWASRSSTRSTCCG